MKFYTRKGYGDVRGALITRPTVTPVAPLPEVTTEEAPTVPPPTVSGFEPSPRAKAKTYGGGALAVGGALGGIALLLKGGPLSSGLKVLSGIASAGALGGGVALAVAGSKQATEEREAAAALAAARKGTLLVPSLREGLESRGLLPDPDVVQRTFEKTEFFKREHPGVSASGVEATVGDWSVTIYDRERGKEYTILCTEFPKAGARELLEFHITDPGRSMASALNRVSFVDEPTAGGLHKLHTWGRGEKIPRAIRNQVWALRGDRTLPINQMVASVAAATGRDVPEWITGFSGEYGGPLVRVDRALTIQTDAWRDVFRPMFVGIGKLAGAIIVGAIKGFVAGGLAGLVVGAIGGFITGAVNIIKEAMRTGTIGGSIKDMAETMTALAVESEMLREVVGEFDVELRFIADAIDTARTGAVEIKARYDFLLENWVNTRTEIDRLSAQIVAGPEGALAALASNLADRKNIPWRLRTMTIHELF